MPSKHDPPTTMRLPVMPRFPIAIELATVFEVVNHVAMLPATKVELFQSISWALFRNPSLYDPAVNMSKEDPPV